METLEIKKEAAIAAHENARTSGKKLLEDLFGKKTFQKDVTQRIKTFEDALRELNFDKTDFSFSVMNLSQSELAFRKLKLIAKALNEGWEPDFGNFNETKYYPWFTFQEGSNKASGFGFSFDDWTYSYSRTNLGARLCFKTSALAEYAGRQFEDLYRDYFLLE